MHAGVPRLFLPWLVLATLCCVVMWLLPGEETIPLHIGWVTLCLSYGFALWRTTVTVASILGYAVVSGSVLVLRANTGVLGWQETAEIPLMALMALVMAGHVKRRVEAAEQVNAMAADERERLSRRERAARMYSHEMRTPLTIARGYLNLLEEQELTSGQHEDLAVVDDELGRLERVGDRLLRMLTVADLSSRVPTDIDELLVEVSRRWSSITRRRWHVASTVGTMLCSRERFRMCLDTLIENALRYTDEDDVISLYAHVRGTDVVVGVADSGPGLADDLAAAINDQRVDLPDDVHGAGADVKRQTGLGLALVHQVAEYRGGRLRAGRAAEGGAFVEMVIPREAPHAYEARLPAFQHDLTIGARPASPAI